MRGRFKQCGGCVAAHAAEAPSPSMVREKGERVTQIWLVQALERLLETIMCDGDEVPRAAASRPWQHPHPGPRGPPRPENGEPACPVGQSWAGFSRSEIIGFFRPDLNPARPEKCSGITTRAWLLQGRCWRRERGGDASRGGNSRAGLCVGSGSRVAPKAVESRWR
jgi:hypothetical protein